MTNFPRTSPIVTEWSSWPTVVSSGSRSTGPIDGRVVLWFHGTPGACRQVPPDAPDLAREHGLASDRHRASRHRSIDDASLRAGRRLGARRRRVPRRARCRPVRRGRSVGRRTLRARVRCVTCRLVWWRRRCSAGSGRRTATSRRPATPEHYRPSSGSSSLTSAPAGEIFSLVVRPLATVVGLTGVRRLRPLHRARRAIARCSIVRT